MGNNMRVMSPRKTVRQAAEKLGFKLAAFTAYLRREPGSPRNTQWYKAMLDCPCGRRKTLHISESSLPYVETELTEHLRKDGLL